MRVVSLVPSWTETLLSAGVNVVGRSRFCIHPDPQIKAIPAVGGTKDWKWEQLKELKPDLIVLDREENPKFMAEQNEIPVLATHVVSVESMPGQLAQLALRLENSELAALAARWEAVAAWGGLPRWQSGNDIPALVEWGRPVEGAIKSVIYVIWRNPWMTVSKETFVGSMLSKCGFASYLRDFETKYPKFDLSTFPPSETLLLFSSEPYPFLRKKSVLNPVKNPFAFVNGESFSWFGRRSLEFLENLKARGK
jgi:ABC-type Fe3+-hydroxamate transport system substrate-binding protein